MSKRLEKVQGIAARIIDQVKLENGVVVSGSDVYYGVAEAEGVTREALDQVNEFNVDFIAATGIATGEIGSEAMRSDSKVTEITTSFGTATGSVDHTLHRSYKVGDEEKAGYLVSSVETVSRGDDDVIGLVISQVAGLDYDAEAEAE